MKELNPLKIKLEKSTLIEASAGTGKTYTITTLYCRLIAKGYPAESILVVTFTEAAAAELKLRIRQRLSDCLEHLQTPGDKNSDELIQFFNSKKDKEIICARISLALTSFDQAAIFTIHSFCMKVLKENAFDCNYPFDVQLVPDRSLFLNQACIDFFSAHVNNLDPLFLKFLDFKKVNPENFIRTFGPLVSKKEMILKPDNIKFKNLFDEYRQELKSIRKILSNDIEDIIRLFAEHPGVNRRSYSKRTVPAWIESVVLKLEREGDETFFVMTEKGDSLYKFTQSRINETGKPGCEPPCHDFFKSCQRLLELSNGFETNLINLKIKFLQFFNETLEKIKISQGICFFDDLVNDLAFALKKENSINLKQAVRKSYLACLIDEFQDTDPAQYKIFSHFFSSPGTPFFMIGDPKQAIYAFRGGDIFAYLSAAQNSEQQFTLKKNYRSGPLIVQGVNEIFSCDENPFVYEKIRFSKVETPENSFNRIYQDDLPVPPIHFQFIARSKENVSKDGYISSKNADKLIPSMVAADILSLLQSDNGLSDNSQLEVRKISPEDIAVLVRTNDQAHKIQQALSNLNIPAYLSKSESVFDSPQAVDLYDILSAVITPENKGFIKAALCTKVFSFDASQLLELNENEELMFDWQNRFSEYKALWETKGFVSMITALFHSEDAFLKINSRLDERTLTNFYHLVELISQADIVKHLSPFYLVQWYARQMSKEFRDESADELRLESDKKAVAVVTIHKSKGLEYPIVYLPYLWEGQRKNSDDTILFHDPDNDYSLTLDLGSTDLELSRVQFIKEEQAEQKRLLYVALTRASGMCKIMWGGIKNIESSALGQLIHPQENPGTCLDDETMLLDIKRILSRAGQSVFIQSVNTGASDVLPMSSKRDEQESLSVYEFTRKIHPAWKMSSFSSLTQNAHSKNLAAKESIQENPGTDNVVLYQFPKGPKAGDAFHKIFELIDFKLKSDLLTQTVQSVFEEFGFADPEYISTGIHAIENILNTILEAKGSSFCLRDIRPDKCLNEMEFNFSVNGFDTAFFKDTLEKFNPKFKRSGYTQQIENLDNSLVNGFIKGFIDLVFEHQNRWYILDYKTNFLGRTYEAYNPDNIFQAMGEHHYFLQYHIYLVALHRYLKFRLKNYDYNTHFGGVFYLFIRGMNPNYGSEYGVFFDRPSLGIVSSLSGK